MSFVAAADRIPGADEDCVLLRFPWRRLSKKLCMCHHGLLDARTYIDDRSHKPYVSDLRPEFVNRKYIEYQGAPSMLFSVLFVGCLTVLLQRQQAVHAFPVARLPGIAAGGSTNARRRWQQVPRRLQATSAAADDDDETTTEKKQNYVVVGGGWGGWGAAKALTESGHRVTLLDALPDPRLPYLSATGKPVEAGTRGFWMDYPNINQLCDQLNLRNVFTEFTNSSFYSPEGLEATAPVFSSAGFPDTTIPLLSQLSGRSVQDLPSPLGQVLATFPLFERLPLQDRASMVGLLAATVDCFAGDEQVQRSYDRMTAHELFRVFGLSDRLVQDFIRPTLLVGLFKPPTELSALVVMELLYYYALAHVDSFDVRWIRNGTVTSSLIAPLADYLQTNYNDTFTLCSQSPVTQISTDPSTGCVSSIEYQQQLSSSKNNNSNKRSKKKPKLVHMDTVDGVVLAVSSNGMRAIVRNSPDLARCDMLAAAASSSAIDVLSIRIWLDSTVDTRTPANVWASFPELRGAGGTFFMLDQLQGKENRELWGGQEPRGSVVACDFYNAGALLALTDEQLIELITKKLLPAAVPQFADAAVVDSWVGRYPTTVTWFSPGSYDRRPTLETADIPNLKCAGDWVKMGEYEHGAKGLCQERAFVSGLQAANALLRDAGELQGNLHTVLPVREDQQVFRTAKALNQNVMKFLPRFWTR